MADYVEDVAGAARALEAAPVVVGWSMGGLVALMYAVAHPVAAVIALGPSLPGPRLASASSSPLAPGVFGPEVYGIVDPHASEQPTMPDLDPDEVRTALASLGPESGLARQERKRGIPLDPRALRGPVLVVAGERDETVPPAAARALARFVGGRYLEFAAASHWGLVLNRRALDAGLPRVLAWLETPDATLPFPGRVG
jgi:pimeloyl-ACP methyl ester carboxylesterase